MKKSIISPSAPATDRASAPPTGLPAPNRYIYFSAFFPDQDKELFKSILTDCINFKFRSDPSSMDHEATLLALENLTEDLFELQYINPGALDCIKGIIQFLEEPAQLHAAVTSLRSSTAASFLKKLYLELFIEFSRSEFETAFPGRTKTKAHREWRAHLKKWCNTVVIYPLCGCASCSAAA